uniref:Uncharacterized protein n=1 Tax=viral metagenome TaxID=1070528 RepID=A0A6C0K131_9ZZZZ
MSERKTISINPELFSLSGGNTTRKKRPVKENKDLKIKSAAPKQPHSTKTLRNRLLHYIRKNQEENFKKMNGSNPEIVVPDKKYTPNAITDNFNNDFEESLKYMTEISDQVSHKVDNDYMVNQTLRNYKSLNPESILAGGDFDKALEGLQVYDDFPRVDNMDSVKLTAAKQPQWGCMKGGSLPTYRVWSNQTQRVREPMKTNSISHSHSPVPQIDLDNMSMSSIANIGAAGGQLPQPTSSPISTSTFTNTYGGDASGKQAFTTPRLSQLKQTMEKIKTSNESEEKNKIKYGKRKKTIRRTYKLGKSRVTPKVSVLVSNKTVRKNISTKTEKLKQIPIQEIRAVLIKKGFIKVGSLATNDVLRKMYESMLLVCGEVENHNPENMLYNYLHA